MGKKWITKKDKNGSIKHIPIEEKREPYARNERRMSIEEITNNEYSHKVITVYDLDGKHRVVLTPLKDPLLYTFSRKTGNTWYDVELKMHTYKAKSPLGGWLDEPVFYYHYVVHDKDTGIKEYIKPIEDEQTVISILSKLNLNEEKICRLKLLDPVLVRRIEQARMENS